MVCMVPRIEPVQAQGLVPPHLLHKTVLAGDILAMDIRKALFAGDRRIPAVSVIPGRPASFVPVFPVFHRQLHIPAPLSAKFVIDSSLFNKIVHGFPVFFNPHIVEKKQARKVISEPAPHRGQLFVVRAINLNKVAFHAAYCGSFR